MPLEISSFLGDITNNTYSNVGLKCIFDSVIYTSALITFVVLMLICMILPARGVKSWLYIKVGLYIYLTVAAALFLHKSIIKHDYEKTHNDLRLDNMWAKRDLNNIVNRDEMHKVTPNLNAATEQQPAAVEPDMSTMKVGGMIDMLENMV